MVMTSAAGLASMTAISPNTSIASVRRTNDGGAGVCGLSRRPVEGAHQHPEVEAGEVDQIALVQIQ